MELRNVRLCIFDMDGVLTSETAYWDAAGLTIFELIESPAYLGFNSEAPDSGGSEFCGQLAQAGRQTWRNYLPYEIITQCKIRGINSNWDLAYLVFGLYLIPVLEGLHRINRSKFPPEELSIEDFMNWKPSLEDCQNLLISNPLSLFNEIDESATGIALHEQLNTLLENRIGLAGQWFGRETKLWRQCSDLFQSWYLGESLYQRQCGKPIAHEPKPGLIYGEEPMHGLETTTHLLQQLAEAGFELGIATGRPKPEILEPLRRWNLLPFFNSNRIVTYDEVHAAEARWHKRGKKARLGKPHPFSFLKAIFPERSDDELLELSDSPIPNNHEVLIVGDAQADLWAAKAIGCPCAGLLSGTVGESASDAIAACQPTIICRDLIELTGKLISIRAA